MFRVEDIISDEEIIRVHANASFGSISPRDVVNEGVLMYALGYGSGHTMLTILIEHKLVKGKYADPVLSKKGQRYLRALFGVVTPKEILLYLKRENCDA